LDEEIDRAEIVKPEEIPTDVITMNSTFRLSNLDSREEDVYTLVFPGKADSTNGKISILAPVGTAVLGCRVGDTVEWKAVKTPSSPARLETWNLTSGRDRLFVQATSHEKKGQSLTADPYVHGTRSAL
jgi:hypothetical protein